MGMNALEVRRRVMLAQPHEAVAVGAVASFRTDVLSPLKMSFDLLPIQAGTGDPSPENVRPITGHDGFTRTGTGKNLFDGEYTNCGITATGGVYSISNSDSRVAVIPCKPNTTYTATKIEGSNRFIICSADTYPVVGTQLTNYYNSPIEGTESKSFTTNGSAKYIVIGVTTSSAKEEPKMQVELGSTASDFEPYTGTSYSTTFPTPPGTVYGGHVRDNGDGTGTLTVDTAFISTTWGDIGNATEYTDNIRKRMTLPVADNKDKRGDAVCNVAPTTTTGIGYDRVQMVIHESNSYVYITLPKNTASDTPVQIVYYIATPQTYTLSMNAIQSLIGQNHVWVDNADEVSVEYWGH